MRLSQIKPAGFKSFVDPMQVTFPGNLTGVAGPNGWGTSNVIDAVRGVMGGLPAKPLRGDNRADGVFNGSAVRRPAGTASVDNSVGRIGGLHANYTGISLRRQVSRDGSSGCFINGVRCRRKDLTDLFPGIGLGSRRHALIGQGMISRVIEAQVRAEREPLELQRERAQLAGSAAQDALDACEAAQGGRQPLQGSLSAATRAAAQAVERVRGLRDRQADAGRCLEAVETVLEDCRVVESAMAVEATAKPEAQVPPPAPVHARLRARASQKAVHDRQVRHEARCTAQRQVQLGRLAAV